MQLNDTLKFINEVSEKFNMVKLYPNNDLSPMHIKVFTDLPGFEHDMVVTININIDDLEIGIGLPYYEDGKVVSVKMEERLVISNEGNISYFAHPISERHVKPTWLAKYEMYGLTGIDRAGYVFEWDRLAAQIIEKWMKWLQFIKA